MLSSEEIVLVSGGGNKTCPAVLDGLSAVSVACVAYFGAVASKVPNVVLRDTIGGVVMVGGIPVETVSRHFLSCALGMAACTAATGILQAIKTGLCD